MTQSQKYLTDGSLGKLAKWLRLMGFDTIVYPRTINREILNFAYSEKRIVLTRRVDMVKRRFSGQIYLIEGKETEDQLKEIVRKISLKIEKDKIFSICLKCNERLSPVPKEEVFDLVPSYVFANCDNFNRCPNCKRIYWKGTHERNALQFLEKLGNLS
ncbi:MAG: Mut7-C RNAse domain-containing protein [Smithella sp.]